MSRVLFLPVALALVACSGRNETNSHDAGNSNDAGNPVDSGTQQPVPDSGIPPGTTTYNIHVGPLPVSAGTQAVYCTYLHLGNTQPIEVIGYTSTQTIGGHHLILVLNKTDMPDAPPTACNQSTSVDPRTGSMIYISQVDQDSQLFPPQVGVTLPANASLMLQVHYIDATANDLTVSTSVNVLAGAPGSVTIPGAPLLYYAANFSVPPGNSSTFASCVNQNTEPLNFFMLAGHMHSHGTNFTLDFSEPDGGTTEVYQTAQWDSPKEKQFDPPLSVTLGSEFTWTCDYTNDTATTIQEPDEMCAVLGNYYPAEKGALECFALAGGSLCECAYGSGLPDGGL
jgi:hypothetical protein